MPDRNSYVFAAVLVIALCHPVFGAAPKAVKLTMQTKNKVIHHQTEYRQSHVENNEQTDTVTLTNSRFVVENGSSRHDYDFTTGRVMRCNLEKKKYVEHNIIADVGFRAIELHNRIWMADIFTDTENDESEAGGDLFEIETYLGVEASEGNHEGLTRGVLGREKGESKMICQHNGRTVCEIEFTDIRLPAELHRMYGLYLRYTAKLHPRFHQWVIDDGRLPKQIRYKANDTFQAMNITTVFTNIEYVDAVENISLEGMDRESTSNQKLEKILRSIESSEQLPTRTTVEQYKDFASKAEKESRYLDAVLALIECSLQEGIRSDQKISQLITHVNSDTQLALYVQAMETNGQEALNLLEQIKTEKLEKGYLLSIFRGNNMIEPDQAGKAVDSIISALDINPYITGAYVDIGKFYYQQFDTFQAWRCWDAARKIKADHGMLQPVDYLEQQLRSDFPQYFQQ